MNLVKGLAGGVLGMAGGLLVLGFVASGPATSDRAEAKPQSTAGEPVVRIAIPAATSSGAS